MHGPIEPIVGLRTIREAAARIQPWVHRTPVARCGSLDAMVGAKLLVEPSAAVPLAALLAGSLELRGRRVGVVLSGGNVDLDGLPW